ncbi:TonB-dependent receptor plug domain-containing protein [Neisseria sp. Ec49-e6-T10]|uniref:TonB-dependent receptor plug domain-containing protein n=1 Tax=Neisseria sp. Ec49-e6-T10 TaxID=3140744 RepID=UPI003EBA6ABC
MKPTQFALSLIAASICSFSTAAETDTAIIDDIIVTTTARDEMRKKSTSTTQVINQAQIERSGANDLTELLAQNGVGFFSEWTPGQTSINIRGAATDGQGKDFKGQILVLIDGRRAGSANLSKLSPSDIYRIEVVRGPGSVIYGSQAMGGVINIILKNGHNTNGGKLSFSTGSWGLAQGHAQYGWESEDGKLSAYLGLNAGTRDSYKAGKNGTKQQNTGWERYGATGAFGWRVSDQDQLDLTLRTDGIYHVGFRGSSANYHATEDRYNESADLIWQHGQQDEDNLRWKAHGYWVKDVDDFKWASPTTAKTSLDHNKRKLSIAGIKLQPIFNPFESNELLLGFDAEKSWLRSDRKRIGLNGASISQVAPFDNNQTEKVFGFYAEDTQKLFDDRLILRSGVRYTHGKTSYDATPNLKNQLTGSANYHKTTWSFGANYQVNSLLNLRSSIATGFRSPTSSELGADYTTLAGSQIYGNRSLKPETNQQVEIGATLTDSKWRIDLALFENKIKDRIITIPRANSVGGVTVSDYINNPGDVVVHGLEINSQFTLDRLLNIQNGWNWSVLLNGSWNFHMKDKGVSSERNTDKPQRMYRYQASVTNQFGQNNARFPWNIQLNGILRGPMWYDTEEKLIASAEPSSSYIHRKSPFWVWNLRGEVEATKQLSFYAEVTNLFNKNEHPIFIALDKQPYLLQPSSSNGGLGTSMPGRAFNVGVNYYF